MTGPRTVPHDQACPVRQRALQGRTGAGPCRGIPGPDKRHAGGAQGRLGRKRTAPTPGAVHSPRTGREAGPLRPKGPLHMSVAHTPDGAPDRKPRWLSLPAIRWALDDAPDCPAELVATLVAIASYAGLDGRGAYPATDEIARQTRKTRRQARRDIDRLERAGLIMPGDQSLAKHIRADKRPVVYDLAMPRGVTGDPPSDIKVMPNVVHRGDMWGTTGGHPGHHGGSPVTPEEEVITSEKENPLASLGDARARGAPLPSVKPGSEERCGHGAVIGRCAPCRFGVPAYE